MCLTLGRDKFVDIMWDNIEDEYHGQFAKNERSEVMRYGPYDYGSVMHYYDWAFSPSPDVKTIIGKVRRPNATLFAIFYVS